MSKKITVLIFYRYVGSIIKKGARILEKLYIVILYECNNRLLLFFQILLFLFLTDKFNIHQYIHD